MGCTMPRYIVSALPGPGIYIYLEPPFTVLLAALLLGERITAMQIIGFVVITCGVLVSKIPRGNDDTAYRTQKSSAVTETSPRQRDR